MGRPLTRAMSALIAMLALFGASACTPEEVQIFQAITGGGPSSAEEAETICNEAFGPGSAEPGEACYDAAVAVVSQQAVRISSGYQMFNDCREAVDHLFAGRWDHQRALRIVQRESGFQPGAVSRTGARGCAQLTSGIRNAFLEGPWDDPYWNVLAMRSAIDHPDWGWCHWDIRNYCLPGGEF